MFPLFAIGNFPFTLWEIFNAFLSNAIFFKINFFEKFFQKYHPSVKQIGSRSGVLLGLIWVQSVCKGYEQMTLVSNELDMSKYAFFISKMSLLSTHNVC